MKIGTKDIATHLAKSNEQKFLTSGKFLRKSGLNFKNLVHEIITPNQTITQSLNNEQTMQSCSFDVLYWTIAVNPKSSIIYFVLNCDINQYS